MADDSDSIGRQQLLQRAIMVALSGAAAGAAVAIPTEGDTQSPIHPDCISGSGRDLMRRSGIGGDSNWVDQPLPCPPFADYPVNYVFMETKAPKKPQQAGGAPTFPVPLGYRLFAYYEFKLDSSKYFSIGDRVSGGEAFQIPESDLTSIESPDNHSIFIGLCTKNHSEPQPARAWCTAANHSGPIKPKP